MRYVETAKATFDILTPISGKVTEINKNLEDNPQLVNKDPYDEGLCFIVEMKDTQQLKDLLSYKEYEGL